MRDSILENWCDSKAEKEWQRQPFYIHGYGCVVAAHRHRIIFKHTEIEKDCLSLPEGERTDSVCKVLDSFPYTRDGRWKKISDLKESDVGFNEVGVVGLTMNRDYIDSILILEDLYVLADEDRLHFKSANGYRGTIMAIKKNSVVEDIDVDEDEDELVSHCSAPGAVKVIRETRSNYEMIERDCVSPSPVPFPPMPRSDGPTKEEILFSSLTKQPAEINHLFGYWFR